MLPPPPALPHPPVPGGAEQGRMENRRRTLKGGQKSPQQLSTGTGREQDGRERLRARDDAGACSKRACACMHAGFPSG